MTSPEFEKRTVTFERLWLNLMGTPTLLVHRIGFVQSHECLARHKWFRKGETPRAQFGIDDSLGAGIFQQAKANPCVAIVDSAHG